LKYDETLPFAVDVMEKWGSQRECADKRRESISIAIKILEK